MLLRDQGDVSGAEAALDASREIFEALGDVLWAARVLASKAALEDARDGDPVSLMRQARELCRQGGISSEEKISSALREW